MNLLIICIFILNILLILQVLYYYKEFKEIKKSGIKKLILFIAFGFMLLPIKTFALETLFIGNGNVLQRCTSNVCQYQMSGTTNYRAVLNSTSFNLDETYTFNLNFNATTSVASPTLTDCGLNINGAYVTPQSRNSGRTSYECNQNYTRCDSAYRSTLVWTATSNLSNVPVFIQCDMTPQSATYTYTQFGYTINSNQGSVISAIDQASQNEIDTANYNANQNNSNRDSNTDRQINNQNSLFSGLTNTLNTIKSYIGDKIDAVGTGISNVISGLTTGFGNVVSGLTTGFGNVVSAIGNILTPIVDAIGNVGSSIINTGQSIISSIGTGISNIINKLTDLFITCHSGKNMLNIANSSNHLLTNWDGSTTTNNSYNSMIVDTRDYDSIYISGNFALIETGGIRVGKYTDFPSTSTNGTRSNFSSSGALNTTNVNYVLLSFQPAANKTFDDIQNSFQVEYGSTPTPYEPYQNICKPTIFSFFNSFIDFVSNLFNNTIGNTWNQLQDIITIRDTPVTDLILMPLTLIEALHTAITNNTCSAYTIPFDFTGGNNTLTLPCLNLQNYLGSTLWSAIDLILMGLMIYSIGQMAVSFFESWSSLHDTFDYLYNVGPNNKR